MYRNAIILSAGKSKSFAPFTYERPKGLFKVKGEVLIERQIRQLIDAGVQDIYVVVGYMKEKFFYLEDKFGVHLIVNNTFTDCGNILSLYYAREHLDNTYICCSDQYFLDNPFLDSNSGNLSYRACSWIRGKFREFSVSCSDANVITSFSVGGENSLAMIGHAYFNNQFSTAFRRLLEEEINDFGVNTMFWEEFYARHQTELTLFAKLYDSSEIMEFDSIDELRQFDSEFLLNVDSMIIAHICSTLHCHPEQIVDISVIQAGLTNVSFSFRVGGIKYVYRHPGKTAGHLTDRATESYAEKKAKELGIDKSIIWVDISGWKLSYFVDNAVECDFRNNPYQLNTAMEYLHRIHGADRCEGLRDFDTVAEGKKLMRLACAAKGDLFSEFSDLIEKIDRLDRYVKIDSEKLRIERVLCHNDTYEPNYIATADGDLYLIDWEYAGLNDPANDIACILCRDVYSDEQIEKYLRAYFSRELTFEEHRHCIAYIALSGFYWFCWGLYKGSVGDNDGFFFLPAYRNCLRFVVPSLRSYEEQ